MKKNIYTRPTITKVDIDNEISMILMSTETPYVEPSMMMQNSEKDDIEIYNYLNPLKWFK
jgi:hypothetical protein